MGSYGRNYEFRTPRPNLFQIQAWLTGAGFHQGPIDGVFGPQTSDAIRRFQVQAGFGLEADGQLGPKTYKALALGGAGDYEHAIERAKAVHVRPEDMALARAGLERAVALLEED